ncbi:hypothetical protein GCM10010503_56590 [Streptomyces lucensis JCM 4490]|uniref:Uncharacterized protein n=1 Tax=Streptomyces lucensis JCM 4490 TaxID=1306176 RepID=A0A918MUL0_9ACTN|nr:hypothetical protein GCM10010503_56590 [Streptomyces lucensis JCM 4490]
MELSEEAVEQVALGSGVPVVVLASGGAQVGEGELRGLRRGRAGAVERSEALSA